MIANARLGLGLALALATLAVPVRAASDPVVTVESGKLQGVAESGPSPLRIFRGIPFAVPPTGDLRWRDLPELCVLEEFGKRAHVLEPVRDHPLGNLRTPLLSVRFDRRGYVHCRVCQALRRWHGRAPLKLFDTLALESLGFAPIRRLK